MTNRPVHKVQMGAVEASIWANETQTGRRHSVTLSRLYKSGEEWKRTDSFSKSELALVMSALKQAQRWLSSEEG